MKTKLLGALGMLAVTAALAGVMVSLPFFSQRDAAWRTEKLGFSSTRTIGSNGGALASMSMLLRSAGAPVDPKRLNTWLKNNNGFRDYYQVDWSTAANYRNRSWLRYEGTARITSIRQLQDYLYNGRLVIAKSSRFTDRDHFVVFFHADADRQLAYYLDPADPTATKRRLGDGWVNLGAGLRVFDVLVHTL